MGADAPISPIMMPAAAPAERPSGGLNFLFIILV